MSGLSRWVSCMPALARRALWVGIVAFSAPAALGQQSAADLAAVQAAAGKVLTEICGKCHSSKTEIRLNPDHLDKPAYKTVIGDPDNLIPVPADGSEWVLTPGSPSKSIILKQVKKRLIKPDDGMPKGQGPLTGEQFRALATWVACLPADYDPANPPLTCAGDAQQVADAYVADTLKIVKKDDVAVAQTQASGPISISQVVGYITADLESLKVDRRPDARYVLLTNLYNQGVVAAEMDQYRAGLARGLNNLSTRGNIARLLPVDPQATVYRVFLSDLGWTAYDWDALMAEYPYSGLPIDDPLSLGAAAISEATDALAAVLGVHRPRGEFPGELQVFARADWLIRIITHPGRYEKLLRLPESQHALERDLLKIDPEMEVLSRASGVVRGGYPADGLPNDSGVSQYSRIIERHTLPSLRDGYYWKSYDFGQLNSGKGAIPGLPLRPEELSESANAAGLGFKHDGGEMIFSLPNGLQAYFITTVKGTPLPSAPNDIVNLNNDGFTGQALPARMWEYIFLKRFRNAETGDVIAPTKDDIFNGLSCMACHAQGMKDLKSDTVGPYFANLAQAGISSKYTEQDIDLIRYLYGGERLTEAFAADKRAFRSAAVASYRAIGLSESSPGWGALVKDAATLELGPDPVTKLARAYATDITTSLLGASAGDQPEARVARLASELWLDPKSLLQASTGSRQIVSAFAGRAQSQFDRIEREDGNTGRLDALGEIPFECQFSLLAKDMAWIGVRTELRNVLSDGRDICRQETEPPKVSTLTLKASKDAYAIGEKIFIEVAVQDACYLTIVDIDPKGTATVMFPNAYVQDNLIKANSVRTIPSGSDGFGWKFGAGSQGTDKVIATCDRARPDFEGITHDYQNQEFTELKPGHPAIAALIARKDAEISVSVLE